MVQQHDKARIQPPPQLLVRTIPRLTDWGVTFHPDKATQSLPYSDFQVSHFAFKEVQKNPRRIWCQVHTFDGTRASGPKVNQLLLKITNNAG